MPRAPRLHWYFRQPMPHENHLQYKRACLEALARYLDKIGEDYVRRRQHLRDHDITAKKGMA